MNIPVVLACQQATVAELLGALNQPTTVANSFLAVSTLGWMVLCDRLGVDGWELSARVRRWAVGGLIATLVLLVAVYFAHVHHFTPCNVTHDSEPSWRELLLVPGALVLGWNLVCGVVAAWGWRRARSYKGVAERAPSKPGDSLL